MKIAICDDDEKIRFLLKEKILHFYFKQDETEITCFKSGEELLESNLRDMDILFLDVDLPGCSGMDVAKMIRKDNVDIIIVFVTAYGRFVYDSFKVKPFRYLLKPFKEEELIETLQSVFMEVQQGNEDSITFRFQNKSYTVKVNNILYIEGMKGKITIHCKNNRDYRANKALKDWYDIVKEKGFYMVHQSFIINMNKITQYDQNEIELEQVEKSIPISRKNRKDFKDEYMRYWSKVTV